MKPTFLSLFAIFAIPFSANPACQNDYTGEDCCDCDTDPTSAENCKNRPSDACEDAGNPFAAYSGNTIRRVEDLELWNTPGEIPFKFTRLAKSRKVQNAPSYFGTGHQWFHNWDARLLSSGVAGNGDRFYSVRHSNGHVSKFRETPNASHPWTPQNGSWNGQDRLFEKLVANGDTFNGFELRLSSGVTYRFYKYNFGNGDLYRLDEVLDPLQNSYSLSYAANSAWKLNSITAPGNEHKFTLTWGWSNGLQVITKVTASDGRTVTYDYEEITAPEGGNYQALYQADYSDGTFGYYRYSWQRYNFSRPVLSEARDTRVKSGARVVKYTYQTNIWGLLISEKNPLDNSVLVSRSRDNQTGLITINYGNGSSRVLDMNLGAGRLSSEITASGGQKDYTYGGYLNRELRSGTDSNGQKVTYSWRENQHYRPTRVLYDEDGGTQHEVRYSYTDTGLLLFEKVHPSSGGWFPTFYTRDGDGHLTGKSYPDGTSESWTRNAYGDPETHTLRNGATESWEYHDGITGPEGLKKSHTGPAKSGETGATQSWTYYDNGLLKVHTLATGGEITYEYNEVGQVTKETYDDNSFIVRDYTGSSFVINGTLSQTFNDLTSLEKHEGPADTPDIWNYTYDEFGRKLTASDALQHDTTWDYGDAGQGICNTCTTQTSPLKITSAEGRVTRYIYDEMWRPLVVARLADGDGGDNDYEAEATLYDSEGRVTYRISNIVANNVDLANLDFSNPFSVLPYVQNASWTSYDYDLRGRRNTVTRWDGGIPPTVNGSATTGTAVGYITVTDFDGFGNTTAVAAPGNRITTMFYAGSHRAMGQMTSRTISPNGGATTYTTNYTWPNGERLTMTDALNQVTSMTYNGRGQVLTTTYHDQTETENTYYLSGLPHKYIDELDRETIRDYDDYGRSISSQAPGKAPAETFYRVMALGGMDYSLDPTGRRVDYEYDDDGQRERVILAEGTSDEAVTSYFYDDDHLLTSTTDPVGMVTDITYDKLGRRSTVTVPGKNASDLLTTTYTYDTAARSVTTTYPDFTTSVTVRDDLGRTASTTNENSEQIAYLYYLDTSWMTCLIDARSKETKWTYNDLGQMLTKTYSGTPVEKDIYTYDSVQRLHTHTRPSGKIATYDYDDRNRVTDIDWTGPGLYNSGEDQDFTYFDDGRPKTQSNSEATITYAYHPDGDLDTVTQAHSQGSWTVGYDHDDAGRLTDLAYPVNAAGNIETVTHEHNYRGQLSRVYNPSTYSALATYLRRKDGLTSRLDFEAGANTRSYYDTGKRTTGRFHYKPGNGNGFLDRNSYTYDDRSRRISQTWKGNVGARYAYDAAGQVTGVDHGVSSPATASGPITKDHEYTYDAMGNRENFNVTAAGASATVPARYTDYGTANDKNQYVTIGAAGLPPQGTPTYDPDGNLTDDDNRLYVWDAWNRLREVKDKLTGSSIATYHYDALGRRVSKDTTTAAAQGAETVLFIYDGWNVIQEWTSATLDKAYLVWGEDLSGSLQGAGGVGGLLMRQVTGGESLYYHYDANGNPARITNGASSNGTYRYDAFGNVRSAVGYLVNQVGKNPWQFSTKYHDPETGFSYYGYRYYDPVTGRWPSRDPIGERGGINLYGFVGNDGANYFDVLGARPGDGTNSPPPRIPVSRNDYLYPDYSEDIRKVTESLSGLCNEECLDECDGCTVESCKKEAQKIAEAYVSRFHQINKPWSNLGDIHNGWKCYEWAGLMERTLSKLDLICFEINWVGIIQLDQSDGVEYLNHNYILASVKNGDIQKEGCSKILDPWARRSPQSFEPGDKGLHKWNYRHDPDTNEGEKWSGTEWIPHSSPGPWTPSEFSIYQN